MLKKKTSILFAVIIMLFGGIVASADDLKFETYVSYDGYLYITSITGDNLPDTVVFPAEIDGVEVKAINNMQRHSDGESFHSFDLKGVKNIVIEDGLDLESNIIGAENLETVMLSKNVTAVRGFVGASKLHTINLENVETISTYTFQNCTSLKNVDLSNVKALGRYAFAGCTGLTEVDLTNIEEIKAFAFDGVENLTIYGIPGSVAETFAKERGYTFIDSGKEKTEKESIYELYTDESGRVYISAFIGDNIPFAVQLPVNINGTKAIGLAGFEKNGENEKFVPFDLKGIKRLETVYKYEDIGIGFTGTENLEYVSLPYVKTVPDNAFKGASKLSYINLENVEEIGNEAFKGCTSLKEVDLTNVKIIGENAFDENSELKIFGTYGSYAEEYAKIHGFEFKVKYEERRNVSELTVDGHTYAVTAFEAVKLNMLGVLNGIGKDENGKVIFDELRTPTRAEIVTMVVRMLGAEEEAGKLGKTHPFTDVPAWADGYVSYAYENGITTGISDTLFDADSEATPEMYLTFLLRMLGYSDNGDNPDFSWNDPWELAFETRITEADGDYNGFDRRYMFMMTYSAMFAYLKDSETQLFEILIDRGVFTADTWHNVWMFIQ